MRIALLISGRITRYDVCLLPILENTNNHTIDLFLSINNEFSECEYFNIMKEVLKPYIKYCAIKKYIIPQDIFELFNPNESISPSRIQVNLQKINGKFVPYNSLSMYYNDNNAFKMACEYADDNNFEYDCYMKFRCDITNFIFPDNLNISENNLQSIVPYCNFLSCGKYRFPIISDTVVWGNRKTMNIYCNTYNYVLNQIKEYNGIYYVANECSLTDCVYENKLNIDYYSIPYNIDANRRMFDNYEDTRSPIPQRTVETVNNILSYKYEKIPLCIQE